MRNNWAGALVFIGALNSHSQPSQQPKREPGGLKRLLNKGSGCNNTLINYIPISTSCNHFAICTDSVSSIHHNSGNNRYDNEMHAFTSCAGDCGTAAMGNFIETRKIRMAKMLATSMGEKLKLENDSTSKVTVLVLKRAGGIFSSGPSKTQATSV